MGHPTVLFLDYQNVYMSAREQFHDSGASYEHGQIDPIKLGEAIVAGDEYERDLRQIRIYRGLPDSRKDPRGYKACLQQHDAWCSDPRVKVVARPMRYPRGGKPQQKGIHVALALDFASLALDYEYEVGMLFSTDTDLAPALEFVADLRGGHNSFPRVEVAAWSGPKQRYKSRLSLDRNLFCHWLGEDIYRAVADPTKYGKA